jgi:hypothetical protein
MARRFYSRRQLLANAAIAASAIGSPAGRSALARLLAQLSETLAIAPSALGSTRRLTANRRTPFSPRAHYKHGIWF